MMKQQFFKQLMLLICLVAAGAQSAQAQKTPDFTVNGVGYSSGRTGSYPNYDYYAAIMSYTGTAETLTIPDSVINGVDKRKVEAIGAYYLYSYSNLKIDTIVTFSSVKTLTFKGDITIRGTINLPKAETLVFEKYSYWGGLKTPINCPMLTEIHFKGETPSLSGDGSKYFADGRIGSITAYVAGKTQAECDEMMATMAVWCDFKEVRSYQTYSCTLSSDGSGEVFVVDLSDYSSFADEGAQTLARALYLASGSSGSKTDNLFSGDAYAVVYVHSNPAKQPSLKRNGTEVTLNEVTHSGVKYAYYTETNLQEAVTYQWSSTDKQCAVSFTQKQPSNSYGNDYTSKTGTVNIKNGSSQQSFSTATKSYSFTQGSTMEIDIPFDGKVQTLNSIKVDGANTAFLTENGHYKATVPVPFGDRIAVELIWNEPMPAPVVQPPMVTVMRTGEGEVMFYGTRNPNYHGWEDHVIKNCSDPITTMTVPDTDLGNELDNDQWGIRVEVKPAAGQVLRSLKVGLINTNNTAQRPMMQWEEFQNNPDYSNSSYMSYDEATGTYIFDTGGDDMNFWIADYTILVDMGPETVEIENSKTFNFVRKGGEGQAFIYWDDQSYDYNFNEDGSYSVEIPNEQLTDMQMYFEIKEGETFRVFKDGEDITTQFQKSGREYKAELEMVSATYTLLIEKEATTRTISFTDEVVKQICVANWDTDGDGELSYVEARNVTGPSLGEVFAGSDIEYFDEFKYFTGLTMIDDSEFSGCENLKKITLPRTVTHIGNYFFSQCRSLQSIELPSTLVAIGEDAFRESGLKEIYIPASVLTIEGQAFRGSSLELIVIDEDNPVYESGIYRSAVIEKGTQTAQTLCGNSAIPEGVSRLGNWVWTGGEGTILLVVPESVEEIGRNVFSSSLEMLMMKRREPIAFDVKYFGNASLLPANCKLIVPFGTRDAYIAAGWTENIFKGGVVEDDSVLDVNGDGTIDMKDARAIKEKYLNQ